MKKIILLASVILYNLFHSQNIENGLIAKVDFDNSSLLNSINNKPGNSSFFEFGDDRNGNSKSSLKLNGNMTVTFSDLTVGNLFSISVWIKPSNLNKPQGILGDHFWRNNNFYGYLLSINQKSRGDINVGLGNGEWKYFNTNSVLNENKWQHIIITYFNNTLSIYVNGQFIASSIMPYPNSQNDKLGVGNWYSIVNEGCFQGNIDDLRIYNRALSESEILELYNGGGVSSTYSNVSQTNNQTNVNIYESVKKFDCYTSVTPEVFNLKNQNLAILKVSENTLSVISTADWTEKKKIKIEEDDKMKLSSSYMEGNNLFIALYNEKRNEIPNYLKLNLSSLETEKIKCNKTDRGCIISSSSSDYIKPNKNQPYNLNENIIFYRGENGQYYYEVSKIVKEKEDYSKAINGNYKEKVRFLNNYANSQYSKEVEKKLFENLRTLNDVVTFSKENPDYNDKSFNRAYEIVKNSTRKSELKDFLNNFGNTVYANEIKSKIVAIEQKEEQQRIANEQARVQREKEEQQKILAEQKANEQKLAEQKKKEAEYQKYLANKEKERLNRIKNAREGDKICYVQNRVSVYDDREYFFGFLTSGSRKEVNYSMKVICFVEKNAGDRLQVRVGTVSSSNKREYATPVIDGVEYQKGDILWIKPLKDDNWFFED